MGIFIFTVFTPALAQTTVDTGIDTLTPSGLTTVDIRLIVARAIKIFLGLLGIIAIALIVYAGYFWMTSAGDPAKTQRAKDIMKNAAIGLAIILASYAIVAYIFNLLLYATQGGSSEEGENSAFGRGALGAGIIQSHYPPRDAKDIPRNTSIIITFKVPMNLLSIAEWVDVSTANSAHTGNNEKDWDDEWKLFKKWDDDNGDGKKDSSEGDYKKNDDNSYKYNIEVWYMDPNTETKQQFDGHVYTIKSEYDAGAIKTIVIVPDEYLGSQNQDFKHTVAVRNGVKTKNGETPFNPVNYLWNFTTSTVVDLIPPYLMGMELSPEYDATPPGEDDGNYYKNTDGTDGIYNQKRLNASAIPLAYSTRSPCNGIFKRGDLSDPLDGDITDSEEFICQTWPRNVLVQLNFNEAMNPVTAAGRDSYMGVWKYRGDNLTDEFYVPSKIISEITDPNDSTDLQDWIKVAGEFRMSSDYRTLEFWPDEKDGINSCGDQIYILPGPAILRAYVKTGTPKDGNPNSSTYSSQVTLPWDGIVDVASNSFDGNADGYTTATNTYPSQDVNRDTENDAQVFPAMDIHTKEINHPTGPQHYIDYDDFVWTFDTSDEIDLTSPIIIKATPVDGAEHIDKSEPYKVEFSKFMSFTTFTSNDSIQSRATINTAWPWRACGTNDDIDQCKTNCVSDTTCKTDCTNNICIVGSLVSYVSGSNMDYNNIDSSPYDHSGVSIYHETLQTVPNTFYNPVITKSVKDLFQNCYEGACVASADKDNPGPGNTSNNPISAGCATNEANPL